MKRYLIFVGVLIFVAGLAISVGLVTQDVGAYSSGWGDGSNCDTCHARYESNNPHDISAHPSMSDCGTCHTDGVGQGVPPSACLSCHPLSGEKTDDGLATAHAGYGVDVCADCHTVQAATTTTSESTTTTTSESTTTTTGATTTTTEGETTTTTEAETTTTEAPTTTTTVPTGEPDFTG